MLLNFILQGIIKQNVILKLVIIFFISLLATSCVSSRLRTINTQLLNMYEEEQFNTQFTGILVVDIDTKETILEKNSKKYFIPASTVKLFTFYAANTLLKEKIPTLNYVETKDSIYAYGTGDPTWLHPYFEDSTAVKFLANSKKPIVLDFSNFKDTKYRPGWAWEDYQYYFSPEINPIPLYGNVVTVNELNSLEVSPNYFSSAIKRNKPKQLREFYKNEFYIPENLKDTLQIPFITSPELTKILLQEKLQQKVILSKSNRSESKKVLYGIPTDSIYKRMLYKSDNFLAEQLMLVASSNISDTLSFSITKDYILENHLSELTQKPRWVDGSGLSRYNLFTPESMVHVLQKLYAEVDTKRLLHLLPSWNGTGETVLEKPFIYAKSGSMGNTYNLSGYLKTKSGKTYAFCFMNNHFRISTKEVKIQLKKTLTTIHNAY